MTMERLKTHVDKVLSSLLWMTLLKAGGRWTVGSPQVPPHINSDVILYCRKRDFVHCLHAAALGPLSISDLCISGKAPGHGIQYISICRRCSVIFLWYFSY